MKSRLPKLCITSPWNYPLFNPESQSHFGGWEVRIATIAKELARRGDFQVILIVGDHDQPHMEHREGVTLYSWLGRVIWGIPVQNRIAGSQENHPGFFATLRKIFSAGFSTGKRNRSRQALLGGQVGSYTITPEMISIYDEVDADIYMVPGNSQFSGEVAFYCRQRDRKYVFLSGSDYDYYPEYKLHPDGLDMYSVPHVLKNYAIENADAHIVQNARQAEMLHAGYQRSCVIIKNPIDPKPLFPRNAAAKTILWVGKSDERTKRPSIVMNLARQLPEYHFVVILTFSVQETHALCLREARQLSNVTVVERVPFAQIESYFAEARAHLNTSIMEGFPNTFLQAAKYGVPTLSLQVDPGGMLSRHGCGFVCDGDLERLKETIRMVMTDEVACSQLARQSLAYVRDHHDKDLVIPQYERMLTSLLSHPPNQP